MGYIVRVATRAVVRDARQHVPRGKDGGLRESERRSAAETQLKHTKPCEARLLARQTCGMSAPCCGIPCASLVVSPVASKDSCRGHTRVWLAGGGLVS